MQTRPIVVGDTLIRIVGKVAAGLVSRKIGPQLAPLAYGVGISGGGEVITHASRMAAAFIAERESGSIHVSDEELQDPTCILQVDSSNAFNTLGRKFILEGVRKWAPNLVRFYLWSYGQAGALFLSDGTRAGNSESGVRQGCPLGSLYYTLGTLHILEMLKAEFPTVNTLGYIDDITLAPRSCRH